VKKPGVDLASFRISFMGRKAPGAAGGVAEAVGGVALAGADAGAAGAGGAVCACEGLQASRLMHATDMIENLKQGDFNA
jgi:hypothetical protein